MKKYRDPMEDPLSTTPILMRVSGHSQLPLSIISIRTTTTKIEDRKVEEDKDLISTTEEIILTSEPEDELLPAVIRSEVL